MLNRKIESNLTSWYQKEKRKPLLLRGARQVGKSTLVREWVAKNNLTLAEVNLERHPHLNTVFASFDLPKILKELEGISNTSLANPKVILFLDEIQSTPQALAALRYFFEDKPNLPVITAGSLLEFLLAEHDFSMPVGRIEYLHVGPMSFTEFLLAMGDDFLKKIIDDFPTQFEIPVSAHLRLLERQREYLFTGGMPECVATYQKLGSPLAVRDVHRSIIQTYQDDFTKYGAKTKNLLLLQKIFEIFPKIAGKKIKFTSVSADHKSADIKDALDRLIKARLILPCYHTDCSGLPLRAGKNEKIFKPYFLDVGLYNYLCGLEWNDISRLNERELVNEGGLAEQFIAQHLAYAKQGLEPPELFYWLRESRNQNAEVDFVISARQKICPIEVKAGKSGSLKSLLHLIAQKHFSSALRFDLNPPSNQKVTHNLTHAIDGKNHVSFTLDSWPLYCVERL